MSKNVKRGYVSTDEKEFGEEALEILKEAGRDLYYLINRGYHIKGASTFIGNHFMLSERQRLALVRSISTEKMLSLRKSKEIITDLEGSTVYIDGFNTIITLEIAFSGSTLLKCMDGTIRDLAGLRGTYRLIDKTDHAITEIGRALDEKKIKKAVFYLDAPVSNSGRLKQRICDLLESANFEVQVEIINNVDSVLEKLDHVITGDAIILDKCISWFNLTRIIIENTIGEYPYVDFCINGQNVKLR